MKSAQKASSNSVSIDGNDNGRSSSIVERLLMYSSCVFVCYIQRQGTVYVRKRECIVRGAEIVNVCISQSTCIVAMQQFYSIFVLGSENLWVIWHNIFRYFAVFFCRPKICRDEKCVPSTLISDYLLLIKGMRNDHRVNFYYFITITL